MRVFLLYFDAVEARINHLIHHRFHSLTGCSNSPALLSEHWKPINRTQLETLILQQYSHGKFYNLVKNVISTPSVLLTACENLRAKNHGGTSSSDSSSLIDSVSKRFSVKEMARELREERFDVESCCITVLPSRKKGESLVLPNLNLKVVVEAVRMVLEVVYDKRFATFAYGGRVGMGRHTAIRYLKSSVENPSWWFRIRFSPHMFCDHHFRKLSLIMEEKIEDKLLTNLIKRLLESEVLRIEFGGCSMGRGFPQESALSAILINVFFNGLDKEIQDIRLRMDEENPKLDSNELLSSSNVFRKHIRVYAIRYLDEILVITSGSKMLTMDLKNQIVKFLEGKLELKVDKLNTVIHSAVSEKIDFLGVELQAVLPSVLHPPMSEKAIRARKKYLKQKEAKALELRNARETNRKKLGLKILNHVFKKLKQSNGFKFDFHIETEVRDIFRAWGEEVVQEFLGSLEERQNWHRLLSAGDFFYLKSIRDQLPHDLVDAYDQFQMQVDKYLSPVKIRKALEEEKQHVEEKEMKKYSESTVEDLTKLCMKVAAPMHLVRKAVKMAGFTNSMGRPRPIKLLIPLDDTDIIKWYAGIGQRWLDFFCCCRNFKMVKTVEEIKFVFLS
ncbi:PREDICTED: uncharacterized protein LOC104613210 isoform X2 [Nelumbo nucifera]|uniref:Uncharacterized protein LOC104613210 isoform X2 n=1 Tax=Nelumbo nucifera TaxID=4432 RepID=A0A1U8QCK3_NELNU|nr:PREDICTED: uncharacterized protein LOC104613210 isoform X2 [Nelumbo nucifera]